MATPTAPAPNEQATPARSDELLGRLGTSIIHTLLLQIVVGVANAEWLDVPATGNAWTESKPMVLLMIHILLGVALTVLGIWIAVLAFKAKSASWKVPSVIGIIGIIVGMGAGAGFMSANGDAGSTMAMTVGGVVAIGAYVVGLAKSSRQQ